MGAYSYSGTAASNTTIDGIGAAGSDTPDNIDNLIRTLAASDANTIKDLGGANVVAGTADAITVALADVSTPSYFDGMRFAFRVGTDNATTTPTLNVDSLGAKTIKKTIAGVESDLVAGDLQAGATAEVIYRSAWASAAGAFELLNPFQTTVSYATQTLTAAQRGVARANISAALKGHIYGLTLSNNATDATNDIDIAAGEAASTETDPVLMVLSSAITKRLDATWAVGTGNGGLDTGVIANTTYHIWLIQRSDTGVVDALFSTSATSPTMPTSYDRKRRIGSIVRSGGSIRQFIQRDDAFWWTSGITDRSSTSGATWALLTLSVPTGISVSPILNLAAQISANSILSNYIGGGDAGGAYERRVQYLYYGIAEGGDATSVYDPSVNTNTSGQIYFRATIGAGSVVFNTLITVGWVDTRGKDA